MKRGGGGSHLLDFPIALPFPPLGPSVLEPDLGAEVGAEDWGTPPPRSSQQEEPMQGGCQACVPFLLCLVLV